MKTLQDPGGAVTRTRERGNARLEDSASPRPPAAWVRVCRLSDLERERGMAALLDGEQVALFRTHGDRIHAVQQLDPYSGAFVMSRGIVGTRGEIPTVASPMYKQIFDLRTGACLETHGKDERSLRVWPVAADADGDVFIKWKAGR